VPLSGLVIFSSIRT